MINLKNKRILITGASSGIGRALAYNLAGKGTELILSSRDENKLKTVVRLILRKYPDAPAPAIIPCDVTELDDIKRLFNTCKKDHGPIDILINNAGIGVYGEADLITMEDYKKIMEVNYFGAVQCMLEVMPSMKKRRNGMIVNVCSVAAIHGVPYLGAYGASKAALMTFSQSIQAELNDYGISLVVVCPGYTKTRFFRNEKKVGRAVRPNGRYAPAQQVARAIIHTIEHEKHELVLSLEGKALATTHGLFPGLARNAMKKIAKHLIRNK
jgi:short-subunit dehydrogenase